MGGQVQWQNSERMSTPSAITCVTQFRSHRRHATSAVYTAYARTFFLSPMASIPIFELVAFVITLGIVLAVSVPLSGTLVRYRASYNPRGLALDAEGGATPHTGPVVNSYFGMLKRVYQIEVPFLPFLSMFQRSLADLTLSLEGWPGLYKGLSTSSLSDDCRLVSPYLPTGCSAHAVNRLCNCPVRSPFPWLFLPRGNTSLQCTINWHNWSANLSP